MSQEGNLSEQIGALSKKIEDQGRFTRVLVMLCTSAIAAIMFYLTTEVVSSLPMLQLSVDQIQAVYSRNTGNAVGVPAPPAK